MFEREQGDPELAKAYREAIKAAREARQVEQIARNAMWLDRIQCQLKDIGETQDGR